MGHEQSQPGPEPCVLHIMGIVGRDRIFDVEKGMLRQGSEPDEWVFVFWSDISLLAGKAFF